MAFDIQDDQFDLIGEKLKSILKLDFDEKHVAKFARARQLVINNCIYLVPDTFIYSCEMAYASCKAVKELCSLST